MANERRTEVEQVKEQEDVKRALKQTSTVKPAAEPVAETKDKLWLGTLLVHPKEAGRVKTRLIRKLLAALNEAPDRVLFPKSNAR